MSLICPYDILGASPRRPPSGLGTRRWQRIDPPNKHDRVSSVGKALDEHHRSPRLVLAQVSPVAMTLRSTRRSGNPFTYRNLMHWTTNSSSDIEISSCALVAALMLTAAALALVGLAAVR